MDIPGKMAEKIFRWKIEVVEIIMIDKIMTPIAAMLAGNGFVALLSGGVFFRHLPLYFIVYEYRGAVSIVITDTPVRKSRPFIREWSERLRPLAYVSPYQLSW